jgi:acetoin:2,6-dichlorophenolindophenol oxidoreductase subunit alpha
MTAEPAPDPVLLLRRMMTIRQFERTAEVLSDRGLVLGGLHSSAGQEAACVGACAALRPDDYITGTHRSHGHPIAKGAGVGPLVAELLGRESGICHGNSGSMHLADFSVGSLGESAIVGSSLAIAAGAGLAIRMNGEDRVCLAFFGDGASNTGIFHEALNLAAAWALPVVFFCENNKYGVSTPWGSAGSVARVADRAAAYGMVSEVADGQDVLAVYAMTRRAVDHVRAGRGPALIEAETYRYGGHSYRSPDARDGAERDAWLARDPIELFRARLAGTGVLDEAGADALAAEVAAELAAAVDAALAAGYPTAEQLKQDMYAAPLPAHAAVRWEVAPA